MFLQTNVLYKRTLTYILQLNNSRLFLTPHFKPIKWLTAELGAAAFCRRGASVAPYAPVDAAAVGGLEDDSKDKWPPLRMSLLA